MRDSRKSQNGFLLFFLVGEPTVPYAGKASHPGRCRASAVYIAGEEHLAALAFLSDKSEKSAHTMKQKVFPKDLLLFCF